MKAIIEEGDEEIGKRMQHLALAEGALPIHLHTSLFTKSSDNRLLLNCQLSRHLVGLWTSESAEANHMMKRIFVRSTKLFTLRFCKKGNGFSLLDS